MADFDAHYEEAERLRINGNTPDDFRTAIRLYQDYLLFEGPNVILANQMIGVCHQRLHEYDEAIDCYLRAQDGASDYERGNIERDIAESYGALGEYEMAEISLATSLDLLPYDKYPEEHAATLGFLARLQLRQGQIAEAINTAADADSKLHAGRNRHYELYNKIQYALALSRNGQFIKSRLVASRSFMLSVSKDPQTGQRYGSRKHHLRALALFTVGHLLEDYLKKKQSV